MRDIEVGCEFVERDLSWHREVAVFVGCRNRFVLLGSESEVGRLGCIVPLGIDPSDAVNRIVDVVQLTAVTDAPERIACWKQELERPAVIGSISIEEYRLHVQENPEDQTDVVTPVESVEPSTVGLEQLLGGTNTRISRQSGFQSRMIVCRDSQQRHHCLVTRRDELYTLEREIWNGRKRFVKRNLLGWEVCCEESRALFG